MRGIICALVGVALSGAAADNGLTWYVSTDGNDAWSGIVDAPNAAASDGPFATLSRAVEALRELKQAHGGALDQPVTVRMREGTHFLAAPLVLGPGDSGSAACPVTFAAYPGERPVISGGRPIKGWRKAGEHLWAAELEPGWRFRMLRIGDEWAVQARHPNFDPEQPRTGGWLFAQPFPMPEGGGFNHTVSNIHNRGDRLEWRVTAPAPGDYFVWVRYGHHMKSFGADTMDDRTVFGVVGGPKVPLRNLPDTGSWEASHWAHTATLHLDAGEQTLYWENVASGGLDLDAFCLTDDAKWDPASAIHILDWAGACDTQGPEEGKQLIVIQAEAFSDAVGKELKTAAPQPPRIHDHVVVAREDFPQWADWDGGDLHIFPAWGWVNTIVEIHGADAEQATLRVDCPQDIRPGNRFYVAGVREALDGPGEWHLDRTTGTLLYWPTDPAFPELEVAAPALDRLVELRGDAEEERFVEHVRFEGLTFIDSTYSLRQTYQPSDAAVWLAGARHCVIEACTFTRLGGYALRLSDRSSANEIIRNDVRDVGQGGVILVGDAATQARDNLIAANTMQDLGRIYAHVAAIYVTTGSGNVVAHNRIHRVPRYGISLKTYNADSYSHNNTVEYNEIIDSNLETNDTGAIETLGRDRKNTGNIIRFNLIRNVVGLKTSPEGAILSPYFTWGIYLDDYSSGTTLYGNIVDGTVIGGVCIHGGKDNRVENNILLNASEQQLRLQPRDDFMQGNVFARNIVAYHAAESVLWYAYAQTWRPDRLAECDHNLYWCYGDLDIAATERAITPEGPFAAWQGKGLDAHSVVADPRFASKDLAHFGLQGDSPAFALGFEPIPEELIGPEGFAARAHLYRERQRP